jgi:hypothetical protein
MPADSDRIDMDSPILEILEIAKGDHMPEDNPEGFVYDVEYYVLGYFAMVAEDCAQRLIQSC